MSAIPAKAIVAVTPSVLGAGGSALDLSGLLVTPSTRPPIGSVVSFASATDVGSYFGANSVEAAAAAIYFNGFDNSNVKPARCLFAQYPATPVAAYIRGGQVSTLSLSQLQALSGSLSILMDGYPHVAASVVLAAATSFSNAAALINTALNASEPTEATVTASLAINSFTGAIAGSILTVSAVASGLIVPGQVITGAGIAAATTVQSQLTGVTGSTGTYQLNNSQTIGSEAMVASGAGLNVTVTSSGTVAIGQTVTGAGVTAGTIVTALGTGSGGNGTYAVNISQTVASESMTLLATAPVVTYDATAGAFVITSGITGAPSTAAFATGTISAGLKLTSATGALLSQGSAAMTPGAFMDGVVTQTTDWATFMTTTDPDAGVGNTQKLLFSAWVNGKSNRYAYVAWDTDASPTASNAATNSMGYILNQLNSSGTVCINSPDYTLAAFVCGAAASIDFTQKAGRITFDFKSQTGLVANVTNETVANNLISNGYNFYGSYATANQGFVFYNPGSVSGPYDWLDSFINQIWLNNALQLALMELLVNVKSVPYNDAGYALLKAACMDPINQALNFGAMAAGVPLSAAQIAEVNNAAGLNIDTTLANQGYYLQILPAIPQVRAARGSPPMTLWYMDGGSVQKINLASIEVQ